METESTHAFLAEYVKDRLSVAYPDYHFSITQRDDSGFVDLTLYYKALTYTTIRFRPRSGDTVEVLPMFGGKRMTYDPAEPGSFERAVNQILDGLNEYDEHVMRLQRRFRIRP